MSYQSEILADSPVAYWRMGDASGPIVDETGNQNATDHSLTFGTTGIPGGGGDDAITCPSGGAYADFSSIPSAWNVGDTFTLECWLKFTSLGSQSFIYGGTGSFELAMDGSNNPTLFKDANYIAHVAAISLDSNWHHFVATKSGSTTKLYWDGVDATVNDANYTVGNPTSGMSLFNSFGVYTHGAMDEAAIYPTALSAARVLVHYNTGNPTAGQTLAPTTDSVDGAWTNEAGGTTLVGSIDETTASDSDYIQSELAPSASGCRVKLAAGGDPASSSGHEINWRAGKNTTGGQTVNLTVKLYQGGGNSLGGGTLIADFDRNGVDAMTDYTETLSGGEADAITDYTDLYLEFHATAT